MIFPLVLLALSVGCGLLVERLAGARLPGVLLPPVGFAAIVVLSSIAAVTSATARFGAILCLAAAVAGYVAGDRARLLTPDRWAAAAAAGLFLVYGAPVLLTGEATFTGYIKLDDTATWLALTDRAMEHGRSVQGLAPSTYEATLASYITGGYPLGSYLPWGVGGRLLGTDLAWLFQPYMAYVAAMLGLSIYSVVRRLVESPALAAAAAFIGGQPALLYGYVLWGGVKEIVAAALVALVAALVPWAIGADPVPARRMIPLAVAAGATLGALSVGGGVWVGLALVGGLALLLVTRRDPRAAVRPVAAFVAAGALAALPALVSASTFIAGARGLGAETVAGPEEALGNLIRPLEVWQVLGIWPVGDFRIAPDGGAFTVLLIAIAAAAFLAGLAFAIARGAWGLVLWVGSVVVGAGVLAAYGTPWVDGKALSTASPALLATAAAGAAYLLRRPYPAARTAGAIASLALVMGVGWSNALAYRDASIAPRGQLAELQEIGERFAGQGPALMTEYSPYGGRHFLRKVDGESASELRRRALTLRSGQQLPKSGYADIDEFPLAELEPYRLLVLRRSATASRPPSSFRLARAGRWYDVWQRRSDAPAIAEHHPLGNQIEPSGLADCAQVQRLARVAGPGGRLATVFRPPVGSLSLARASHPVSWGGTVDENHLLPDGPGKASAGIDVPADGRYTFWVGGSVRSALELRVDGKRVGSVDGEVNNSGLYIPLGSVALEAGPHRIELDYEGPDLSPGSGADAAPLGPLVWSTADARRPVRYVDASRAESLCGRALDWIEALPAG